MLVFEYAILVVTAVWETLLDMAPYLLLGFFVAGFLHMVMPVGMVERHLGRGKVASVFKAALFGVPLPLCSCSVIPVAASLRKNGANPGATTAFLAATPQTGVDSMLVMYSLLGLTFACFSPAAALMTGVTAGLAVAFFGGRSEAHEVPKAACCHGEEKKERPRLRDALVHGFVQLPKDIANPLLIGLLIAGVLRALIPPESLSNSLGDGFTMKLIMLVAGMPLYVCATASVPIAVSLIVSGVSPGAALVFLMSGPATNAATLSTIWKMLGKKSLVIYLVSIAVCSLGAGVLLDRVYTHTGGQALPHHHEMLPMALRMVLAVGLLLLLVVTRYGGVFRKKKPSCCHAD